MKKTYDEKLTNINTWVEIVNYHWERLKGDLYNDKDFWNDTLHSMTNEDWWDWCDISPALKAQHPDVFAKYPYTEISTEEVLKQLHKCKPIVKKNIAGKNFAAFRTLMNIKDVMNEIAGTPTKQYPKVSPKPSQPPKKPGSTFSDLFEIT